MFLIATMREVEARYVHASSDKFRRFFGAFNRRAHRADNFRAAHVRTLFHHSWITEFRPSKDEQLARLEQEVESPPSNVDRLLMQRYDLRRLPKQ